MVVTVVDGWSPEAGWRVPSVHRSQHALGAQAMRLARQALAGGLMLRIVRQAWLCTCPSLLAQEPFMASWKIPFYNWMIWRYPHFRKPPCPFKHLVHLWTGFADSRANPSGTVMCRTTEQQEQKNLQLYHKANSHYAHCK